MDLKLYKQIMSITDEIRGLNLDVQKKISALEALWSGRKKRAKVPTLEQLSDKNLGDANPSRKKRKIAERNRKIILGKAKVVFGDKLVSTAHKVVLEGIMAMGNRATGTEIRAFPGVSVKNASRLIGNMTRRGLIATTNGGKYRVANPPEHQNGV